MKTKGKNLGIIFGTIGVIGILLIAGCINEEKKEEKQELTCNKPYIKVGNECCLDKDDNGICDKDETPAETKTEELKEEPSEVEVTEKVNETEKLDEREEVEVWCLEWGDYAINRGGGTVAMTNDVKKYKGKWMCHNKYFLGDGGWIDLYWTKYEEEVYKVTTHHDGTVEEVKSGSLAEESEEEYDVCKNIEDSSERNTCYINLAVSRGDASICNRLGMGVHDQCYKEVAISKEDLLLCGRIEDNDVKDDCYNALAVSGGDSSICGKIQKQEKRDDCYNEIALSKEDSSICGKIDTSGKKYDCYNTIALLKENASICDEIKISVKRDDCYNEIALSKEDTSICYKIEDNTQRDDCFEYIALSKEDSSICAEIKSKSKRDDCYNDIALSGKDLSICNKIENEGKRESCYESVEE